MDDKPQTGWDISPQQLSTTVDFSEDAQTESAKMVAPRSGQATTHTLSAAVETCLGEFSMPESLDEPLQGKVYISSSQAVGQWAARLLKAYKGGTVIEAIALLPLEHQAFTEFSDYALCPLPNGLVAIYLGKRVASFVMCFEDLGTVWHRYGWRP